MEHKVDEDRIFYTFVHCLHARLSVWHGKWTNTINLFEYALLVFPLPKTWLLSENVLPLYLPHVGFFFLLGWICFLSQSPCTKGPELGADDLLVPHCHTQTILTPSSINPHCLKIIRLDHLGPVSCGPRAFPLIPWGLEAMPHCHYPDHHLIIILAHFIDFIIVGHYPTPKILSSWHLLQRFCLPQSALTLTLLLLITVNHPFQASYAITTHLSSQLTPPAPQLQQPSQPTGPSIRWSSTFSLSHTPARRTILASAHGRFHSLSLNPFVVHSTLLPFLTSWSPPGKIPAMQTTWLSSTLPPGN